MNRRSFVPVLVAALAASLGSVGCGAAQESRMIPLPAPDTAGGVTLTRTLVERRSVRAFAETPITLREVAQLLWAAQGVTQQESEPAGWRSEWGPWQGGLRTAPSAGALYPLELYLAAARVDGLPPGLYHYLPAAHALEPSGSCTPEELAGAALQQRSVAEAPAVVVLTGVFERTAAKYGDRAARYVHIEVGAAGENLLLEAAALGLGGVFTGAFRDEAVAEVLGLPEGHAPLGLIPVGRAR